MPKHAKINSFDQISNSNAVLIFSSKTCGPCRRFEQELINFNPEDIDIYPVDAHEASDLVRRFGVQSVPHCVYLKDKKEVASSLGSMLLNEFEAKLKEVFD